ncbi:hypothetical protein V8G54_012055, partial [Vigna mungo]
SNDSLKSTLPKESDSQSLSYKLLSCTCLNEVENPLSVPTSTWTLPLQKSSSTSSSWTLTSSSWDPFQLLTSQSSCPFPALSTPTSSSPSPSTTTTSSPSPSPSTPTSSS